MLKHEDVPQTQAQTLSSSAAQVRVTPEELAAAVTALQLRKEGSPGTIAIGDAVEELGLDVSPEEVLAEVQSRRKAKPKRRRDYRALACAVVCAAPLVFGALVSLSVPPAQPLQIDPQQLKVLDHSSRQVLASEVRNDQVFHCRLVGETPSAADYFSNTGNPAWTLVKHDGKIYVRGWIPKVSDKVLDVEGADVVSRPDSQDSVPVTLSVDAFKVTPQSVSQYSTDYENMPSFHAVNVHLDKHAYEKW